MRATAAAAAARDLACLRLDLRGANRLGEDYYHAALTADLRAAIGSAPLSGYERLLVVGFSLGGHIALRHLLEEVDPRLDGVAAVCPPLDLAACCHWIDRRGGGIYRRYLLRKLMEIYEPVAARHEVPVAVEEARAIRSQREFDDRVIAPRHGFDGVDDYYRRASVGPRLGRIRHRALLVLAEDDPMIPRASQQRYVGGAGPGVVVRWVPGGHVRSRRV